MLRVRDEQPWAMARDDNAVRKAPSPTRNPLKLTAMAVCGVALGAAATVLSVSLVQAEDADIRAVQRMDASERRARAEMRERALPVTAYAPARSTWSLPLVQTGPDGRIAHPPVELNPFKRTAVPKAAKRGGSGTAVAGIASASIAAGGAQTICVRLCDGFHAPLGIIRVAADWKNHDSLCQAMNPGIPVRVFRLANGATDIGEARSADGRRYRDLPMAFAHEKTGDAACRPAIVKRGEQRVSVYRDFTLRPGDSVVLNGNVKTFAGSDRFPYRDSDFRDFRAATELSGKARREIDERVGISRLEAQERSVRRQMRLRQASLDDGVVSDASLLRGTLEPSPRNAIRVIALPGREPI